MTAEEKRKSDRHKKGEEKLFGKVKKIPVIPPFQAPGEEIEPKESFELIKVIGLEPEKLFTRVDKYKVQVSRMPKFSNTFDNYESFIPGLGGSNATAISLPGHLANPGGTGSYAR